MVGLNSFVSHRIISNCNDIVNVVIYTPSVKILNYCDISYIYIKLLRFIHI